MKIIHLADTHLVQAGEKLFELDPEQRLKDCIRDINSVLSISADIRHFQQTIFFFHSLYNVERKTQADTARQLGVTRSGEFCRIGAPLYPEIVFFSHEKS